MEMVSDRNKGYELFKIIECKLVEDLAFIRTNAARQVVHDRRRLQLRFAHSTDQTAGSVATEPQLPQLNDTEVLKEAYDMAARSKIHVFISSDNEEGIIHQL